MVEGQEEKEFQQLHWWKAKVCHLGLYTGGQSLKGKTVQNAYMVALFVSFGAKSSSQQRFG
jgi:hypothetical protein